MPVGLEMWASCNELLNSLVLNWEVVLNNTVFKLRIDM
jgi:hypothetical protein